MTKAELVAAVVKKTGLKKKDAAAAVDAVFDAIKASLKKGQPVRVVGFGTFEVRRRAARTGVNPQTGEKIKIPARRVPAFKPAAALKSAVSR